MKPEAYTFFVASNRKGSFRKITLPGYVLHLVAILAVVGGVTVLAAAGSYTRMLWKVGNYNTLRRQQDTLKHNYEKLQSSVKDTNERMNSLQSLATEVAMTYGFMRFRQSPFGVNETSQASATAGSSNPWRNSISWKEMSARRPFRRAACSCSPRRAWRT